MTDVPAPTPYREWSTAELLAHRQWLHDQLEIERALDDQAGQAHLGRDLKRVERELIVGRGRIVQ